MRRSVVFAVTTATAIAATPQRVPSPPREFRVDAGHSMVEFSIGFLGARVRGEFDGVEGIISLDSATPARNGVAVVIPVRNIRTGSAHRDEHLRSEDFFDAERWPTITFHTDSVSCRGASCRLTGPLRIHGVTRHVSFDAIARGPVTNDPHGTALVSYVATVRLARRDFGILGGSVHNSWFDELRSRTMSDTVDIRLEIRGWDTDFARVHTYDAAADRLTRDGIGAIESRLLTLKPFGADSLAGVPYQLESTSRVLMLRGRQSLALDLLRLGIRIFPDSSDSYAALGRAHEVVGNSDSAAAHARRAVSLRPDAPRALELSRRLKR